MKRALQIVVVAMVAMSVAGCTSSHPVATKTVAQRLAEYGPAARARLKPHFEQAGISYPPQKVAFVGFKIERELQVYAATDLREWKFINAYPILGASGSIGPKIREGDRQVPEGIYSIDWLNPNSRHEVSMQIGYPNAFDREQAAREGRSDPGGEIMIHGGNTSIGCLAVGDEASADLFVLTADAGISNVIVVLSPVDFRAGKSLPKTVQLPDWTTNIYQQIQSRLLELPLPDQP